MVDKIDPTNMSSVEYGQSLLERKYKQEEKFAEEARKDRKINYAMQVLGGVDNLIKERAARNVLERNSQLDQDIIRERAEFNKLQKIYNDQSEWRKYEELGPTAVYGYARQLANTDLTNMYGDPKTLPVDGEIRADYDKDLKRMTEQYYNNYINNKVTMPFETVEEYVAPLEALKNKQVPSGLLDIALRKTGLREDKGEQIKLEIANRRKSYDDRLSERKDVKGSVDNLTDEDKLRLLRTPPPVKSTVEYETTIKNGLGQEVSAIGIKTTVGNDTRITGYRFPGSNEVVSVTQFHGSTKKGAEMLLNMAESKIRKMEGMEDATKRQIQNYIFANPEQFPDLKAQMYTHGLVIQRVTAFDSNEEGYSGIAKGAVSNIRNNPAHPSYDAVTTMKDIQREALAIGILESMKAINEYGRINEDGTITYLNDVDSIVSLATAEQLEGVSFAERGMRDDVAIYKMVTPRSLNPPFETLEPEEGDTPETLKSKGTRVINSLLSEQNFLDADYPERRELVDRVEGIYKIEFDVPSELLNPPATPLVDEVDEVDIFGPPKPTLDEQVEDLRRPRDDLLRPDGTEKDPTGFLGPIRNNVTGEIMSEVSMGIGPKDNQTLIPLLVPTLTEEEIETLQNMKLKGNVANIPQSIKDKAVRHAQEREEKGLSPFYGSDDFLPLTGDEDFDSFRVGSEMLLLDDEGLTDQEAQELLDKQKEMLSPSRPEFRELTKEELAQQRKEERDAATLRRQEERDARISEEDKTRLAKEKEIKDNIKESVKTFLNNDPEMNRIKMYADGTLSKNQKPKPTSPLGELLSRYGLEDMSREEIKRWLIEQIETKYSPSDIQEELAKGNPVFVGDYRDV